VKAQQKTVLKGHAASVYCLFIDTASSRILSGGADNMLGAWKADELVPDGFSIKLNASVFSIYKSDDLLFLGQASGGVHIFDLSLKREIRHLKYHTRPVFDIVAHDTIPVFYFLGGDGVLSIVDSDDFSLRWSLPLSDDKLRTAIIDSGGNRLLIGSSDGYLRMLETEYYNVLDEFMAHEGGVYDLAWLSEKQLLTVGRDGHVRIWNYTEDRLVQKTAVPAHNFAIYSVDVSPSGKLFATGSRDKTIKVWDPKHMKQPLRISRKGPVGHTHSVNVVKWINESLLLSAGDDRDLHFWTISNS